MMIYTHYPRSIQRGFLALSIGLAIVIAAKSLSPAMPSFTISNGDKIIHISAYFCLSVTTFPALRRLPILLVLVGIFCFGGLIELAQGLLDSGRTADILDALANGSGATLALGFWLLYTRLLPNSS